MFESHSALFQSSAVYKPFHYPWAVDVTREHEKMRPTINYRRSR